MCYHAVRGFKVLLIVADMKFKSLNDYNNLGVSINIASKNEHAKLVKRFHRVRMH